MPGSCVRFGSAGVAGLLGCGGCGAVELGCGDGGGDADQSGVDPAVVQPAQVHAVVAGRADDGVDVAVQSSSRGNCEVSSCSNAPGAISLSSSGGAGSSPIHLTLGSFLLGRGEAKTGIQPTLFSYVRPWQRLPVMWRPCQRCLSSNPFPDTDVGVDGLGSSWAFLVHLRGLAPLA
jgi:hypothetical protein